MLTGGSFRNFLLQELVKILLRQLHEFIQEFFLTLFKQFLHRILQIVLSETCPGFLPEISTKFLQRIFMDLFQRINRVFLQEFLQQLVPRLPYKFIPEVSLGVSKLNPTKTPPEYNKKNLPVKPAH